MILVMDDDDSIRELILKIVGSSGHDALPARNGLEAVAIFQVVSRLDRPDYHGS